MNVVSYIENGGMSWEEISRMAEAEGYEAELENVRGWQRLVYYIGAGDGKTTWVVVEPENKLVSTAATISSMKAFVPRTKTVKPLGRCQECKAPATVRVETPGFPCADEYCAACADLYV